LQEESSEYIAMMKTVPLRATGQEGHGHLWQKRELQIKTILFTTNTTYYKDITIRVCQIWGKNTKPRKITAQNNTLYTQIPFS